MSKFVHIIGIRNVSDSLATKKSDSWLNIDYIRSFSFFRLKMTEGAHETSIPAVDITLSDGTKVVSDDVKSFKLLIRDNDINQRKDEHL